MAEVERLPGSSQDQGCDSVSTLGGVVRKGITEEVMCPLRTKRLVEISHARTRERKLCRQDFYSS